jgi:hypothetical protein
MHIARLEHSQRRGDGEPTGSRPELVCVRDPLRTRIFGAPGRDQSCAHGSSTREARSCPCEGLHRQISDVAYTDGRRRVTPFTDRAIWAASPLARGGIGLVGYGPTS